MYKNLNYNQRKEIDNKIELIVIAILLIIFITIIFTSANVVYNHFLKNNITIEEYIIDNNYKSTMATFYDDKIILNDIEKDFIQINNESLDDYWEKQGYKPKVKETHEIYYNGNDLKTKSNIKTTVDSQNVSRNEALAFTIIYTIFSICLIFLTFLFIMGEYIDNIIDVFHNILKDKLAKKYVIKM